MSENVPPGGNTTKPATTSNNNQIRVTSDRPGVPYYEKLRRDLEEIIRQKALLDRNLAAVEDQIFRTETSYLEDTSAAGNIVKGFDNYIKASAASSAAGAGGSGTISGSAAGGTRRKAVVNDGDRVFSKSSVGWNSNRDDGTGTGTPNSAVSTPGRTGTPTTGAGGGFPEKAGAGGDKKKKKSALNSSHHNNHHDDGEGEGRTTKRQKITFGQHGNGGGRKGHDD